jgi:hypothetical protein
MLVCAEHCCVRSRRAGIAAAFGNAAPGFMDRSTRAVLKSYSRDQSRAPAGGEKRKGTKERRSEKQKTRKLYKKPMESVCQSPSSRRIRDASAVNLPSDKMVNPSPMPPAYRALASGPTTDLSCHPLYSQFPHLSPGAERTRCSSFYSIFPFTR